MATRSHFLQDFLESELQRQEKEHKEGKLYGLYQVFSEQVFHELTLGEFADAFAQMLAYGLFLRDLNSDDKQITLANARRFVSAPARRAGQIFASPRRSDAPVTASCRSEGGRAVPVADAAAGSISAICLVA